MLIALYYSRSLASDPPLFLYGTCIHVEVFVSHAQTSTKIAISLVSEVLVTYKAVVVKHVALGIN